LVDLTSLTPEERQALQMALRGQEGASEPSIDPALVGMLVRGVGSLEAALLSQRYGLDPVQCRAAIGPDEPLLSMIGEAGAKVVAKYNLCGRWGEEIALCSLIAIWQGGALQALNALSVAASARKIAPRASGSEADSAPRRTDGRDSDIELT
jgi:hypothetical protein